MTTHINIDGYWTVSDGPSREDLFDALRLFNEHRRVEFTLGSPMPGRHTPYTLLAQVNSVQAEDGSGHSWNVTVYFDEVPNQLTLNRRGPHTLYYHDKRRKGTVLESRLGDKI
jgi:hypothetical protein